MRVQRFDFACDVQKSLGLPPGDLVLYSDYEKLHAEVERLTAIARAQAEDGEHLREKLDKFRAQIEATANWLQDREAVGDRVIADLRGCLATQPEKPPEPAGGVK